MANLGKNFVLAHIRLCHTAAILSRETKKALFYHAEPRSQNPGARLSVVKQSFFDLPGQYGRRVTKGNKEHFPIYCLTHIYPYMEDHYPYMDMWVSMKF